MSTLHSNDIFAEHYLLKERLGSQGIAEVWKAEDWMAEGEIVVIKILAPNTRLDSYTLDMLSKEYANLTSLKHPHLLALYRFGIFEGIPFLVMPFVAQGSLRQRLLETGPLPEEELALVLTQISSALDYLHTQRPTILHRHVTPDNILISDNEYYVLSVPEISTQLNNALHKATGGQYTAATSYAAPEFFRAHPVHHEAGDIFSLGVTLYELSTGELPWMGNGGLSLHKGAEVPYLPGSYTRIWSNLVRACLHPDYEKRPTAGLLKEEADYFVKYGRWKSYGNFGDVTAESIVYQKRPAFLPILLASIFVLAALAAAYYFYFKDQFRPGEKTATLNGTAHSAGQARDDTTARIEPKSQPDRETVQSRTDTPQTEKVPTTKPPASAVPKQEATNTTSQPEVVHRPAASQKAAYTQPNNLEDYLNAMLNEEIPLNVKDRWRPAIRRYFSPDAIVYAKMNGAPLGSFGVNEFLDILLSSETGSSIHIDKIIRDEQDDKIDEINVSLSSVD